MRDPLDLIGHFAPHPKQLQFLLAWRRFNLALTGIGFGKSWALTLKALLAAIINRRAQTLLAGRTYRDLNDVLMLLLLSHADTIHEAVGVQVIQRWDRADGLLHLFGGGKLLCRSYERIDKLRGLNLGAAFVDEIERSSANPDDVFGVINERVRVPCPLHGLHFATTPNGLLGVTAKFYEAQARGDTAYHVTHGTTLDNPHLSPGLVDNLKSSMSRRRWEQEVEGRILRPSHSVYSEFGSHLMVEWDWRQHKRLPWVLGVDWGYNHHHVALMVQVLEDGTWVVADELICDDMPRGTFKRELRAWVEHKVADCGMRWPSAAAVDRAVPELNQWLMGWLGTGGTYVRACRTHREQFVLNGIELVRDRLQPAFGPPMLHFAKSLRKPNSKTTAGIIQAMQEYRYQIDREGNPKRTPYKDDLTDHVCFPSWAPVDAPGGAVPIAQVRSGDMVNTDHGPRAVIARVCTGVALLWRLDLADGRSIVATGDHPFPVVSGGVKRLDALRYGDMLWSCEENESSSMVTGTGATRIQQTRQTGAISSVAGARCTATFGSSTMVRSPMVTTSTTLTATSVTTTSATLSASVRRSTAPGTLGRTTSALRRGLAYSAMVTKSGSTNGEERPKAAPGIPSTRAKSTSGATSANTHAKSAARRSPAPRSAVSGSATTDVRPDIGTSQASTTLISSAPSAGSPSGGTSTCAPRLVPVCVVAVTSLGFASPVHAMAVEGPRTFMVNGVLVKNCDALRMLYVTTRGDPALHGGQPLQLGGADDGRSPSQESHKDPDY